MTALLVAEAGACLPDRTKSAHPSRFLIQNKNEHKSAPVASLLRWNGTPHRRHRVSQIKGSCRGGQRLHAKVTGAERFGLAEVKKRCPGSTCLNLHGFLL